MRLPGGGASLGERAGTVQLRAARAGVASPGWRASGFALGCACEGWHSARGSRAAGADAEFAKSIACRAGVAADAADRDALPDYIYNWLKPAGT